MKSGYISIGTIFHLVQWNVKPSTKRSWSCQQEKLVLLLTYAWPLSLLANITERCKYQVLEPSICKVYAQYSISNLKKEGNTLEISFKPARCAELFGKLSFQ